MPNGEGYRSKSQMRLMFAKEARGEVRKGTARRWARETKSIRHLPEKVKRRKPSQRESRRG